MELTQELRIRLVACVISQLHKIADDHVAHPDAAQIKRYEEIQNWFGSKLPLLSEKMKARNVIDDTLDLAELLISQEVT